MEKLKKKLLEKKGDLLLQSVGLLIILCVGAGVLFEFARVSIVKRGVRDMVTQAVTAGSAYNLYNAYDGVREENSATWDKIEKTAPWEDVVETEDVAARMVELFSMEQEGLTLHKFNGGRLEFSLESMEVKAQNPAVGSRGRKEITYTITYTLALPWSWESIPPMRFEMEQESIYRPKY